MGSIYYVSARTGSDKNPGTLEKPFKSIQTGINKTTPGDTVYVREGVYAEQLVISKSATEAEPITIAAYQKEKPVVDGRNMSLKENARLVLVTYSRHVVFSGFEVRQSGGRGIGIDSSAFITVSGCTVTECQSGGIYATNSDNVTIESSNIYDCARKFLSVGNYTLSVALLFQNSRNVTARNNRVYENTGQGIGMLFVLGANIVGNTCYDNRIVQIDVVSSRTIRIDRNFCYHTGRQQYLDLNGQRPPAIVKGNQYRYQEAGVWHSQDIIVSNNVVSGCGRGFYTDAKGGALTTVQVVHNTIVNSTEAAIDVDARQDHVGAIFENNLIANQGAFVPVRVRNKRGLIWRSNMWSQMPEEYAFNPASDIVDVNVGLKNISAPATAGQLSPDAYELTGDSAAVNRGRASQVTLDFWGSARGGRPDIGAHEFDSDGVGGGEVELPPEGTRVTEGLQALYDFRSGWGNTVADTSGMGDPLNLTIAQTTAVRWGNNGLTVIAPTTIASNQPATKITQACKARDEITLEAWIRPANLEQDGPARIVSISKDTNNRNVTLGQGLKPGDGGDLYNVRLRTSTSTDNGLPSLSSAAGSVETEMSHVVFTRTAAGKALLYIDGQERAIDTLRGSFGTWDNTMRLFLANEAGGTRPWLGMYRLVAIYDRALLPEEIVHNYQAGLAILPPVEVVFGIGLGQEIGAAPHQVDFNSDQTMALVGIASYLWEFGDGATSTEANPSHTYQRVGTYTVKLTVTDRNGESSSRTAEAFITVTNRPMPPLPETFARFVLANVVESRILGYGIQFSDLRCMLAWNEEPRHTLFYREFADIVDKFVVPGTVETIWIDYPEQGIG